MRVGIFYFSLTRQFDSTPVLHSGSGSTTVIGFVRCEEVEAPDLSEALDMAQMRDGETVMNAHPLDAKDWDRE